MRRCTSTYRDTNLFHSFALPKGSRRRLLIYRVEVDRDTIGNGNLVSAGIATANGAATLVHTMRNAHTCQLFG